MKTPYRCVVVSALLLVGNSLGCGGASSKPAAPGQFNKVGGMVSNDEKAAAPAAAPLEGKAAAPVAADAGKPEAPPLIRKIIYTATLKLQVTDFDQAEESLLRLIEEHKGLLETYDVTGTPGHSRLGQWKVRVPLENLQPFRKALQKLGELENTSLNSQEVTEEFYDLIERIKNKQREVDDFRRLYGDAKTVADKLAVKRELDRAQEELERFKGRQRYLENMTSLTTVHVWLRERGAYVPEESPDFGTSMGRTFADSLGALVRVARGLALVAVAVAPWLPVLLVFALPLYLWRRLKRG